MDRIGTIDDEELNFIKTWKVISASARSPLGRREEKEITTERRKLTTKHPKEKERRVVKTTRELVSHPSR